MSQSEFTRRSLLAAAALPLSTAVGQTVQPAAGFVDILRPPDSVTVQLEKEFVPLAKTGARWSARGHLGRNRASRR
ncbi:hypothetical protein [Paludibaculum fermentans]|uniref:hypothetical protein n=1 Tax=Paludibaculum fermentans TaxID=1473598 RepID=UPI003EBC67E4